jgi:hypothetical protein
MRAGVLTAVVAILTVWGTASALALTDGQVRDLMIKDSIKSYSGACPCPYSFTAEGLRCGTQSAWSKKHGTPSCYRQDIDDPAVADYRKKNGL